MSIGLLYDIAEMVLISALFVRGFVQNQMIENTQRDIHDLNRTIKQLQAKNGMRADGIDKR